jgi:hypothetical protein
MDYIDAAGVAGQDLINIRQTEIAMGLCQAGLF